jgi:hypothetical protein
LNDHFWLKNDGEKWSRKKYFEIPHAPSEHVPPILGQLLDLISPTKINISEPRLESYDPWNIKVF